MPELQFLTQRDRRRRRSPRASWLALPLTLLTLLAPEALLAPAAASEPAISDTARLGPALRYAGPRPLDGEAVPDMIRSLARPSQAPDTGRGPSLDARYEAALDAALASADAYGATFATVRDGEVVWSGASGTAPDGRTQLEASTSLVIGSVTKTFVAAAVLQLVEEERLSLDDSVRTHLPELPISQGITVRQLLDHTSGLADLFNDTTRRGIEEDPERGWSTAQILGSLHEPWYEPGDGWAYANTNYLLLSLLVERLCDRALQDELGQRFLEPLDLDGTRLLIPLDEIDDPLEPAWTTIFWGSGAMVSSATDLARWGDALYDDDDLLGDDARAEMLAVNHEDYGLGVQRIEVSEEKGYGHSGLLQTYTTLLLHLPEDHVTLALLVNRSRADLGAMLTARPDDGPSLLDLVLGE
ncbi:MAG: serine hydrolase domain-containing protein [Candidatus Limnocylindria bacterium]